MRSEREARDLLRANSSDSASSSAGILGKLFAGLLALSLATLIFTETSTSSYRDRAIKGFHKNEDKLTAGFNQVITQHELQRWLRMDLLRGEQIRKGVWGSAGGMSARHAQRLAATIQLEHNVSHNQNLSAHRNTPTSVDAEDMVHVYSYGVEDANNSAVKEIQEADRLVTEPDDVVAAEEEERMAARLRQMWKEGNATERAIAEGRGEFEWVERGNVSEAHGDGGGGGAGATGGNASNVTGVWVWCRNASDLRAVRWKGGVLAGVGVLRRNETLLTIRAKCVVVDGPGFGDGGSGEDEDEDEDEEWMERHWDQPFMTYEPHPSSVGWDKKHWRRSDWVIWLLSGPVVTVLFCGAILYLFGPLWAMGALVVLISFDALTFYWNW